MKCLAPSTAQLTMMSESKSWKLLVQDVEDVVVSGATEFSCAWTRRKVVVHFVEIGDGEGIVLSLNVL
jgi:hypothetical protein